MTSVNAIILIAALLYVVLLVRVAKPRPITLPIRATQDALKIQESLSRVCILVSLVLTSGGLVNANKVRSNPEAMHNSRTLVTGVLFDLVCFPLLLALSMRWKRTVQLKWQALSAKSVEKDDSRTNALETN